MQEQQQQQPGGASSPLHPLARRPSVSSSVRTTSSAGSGSSYVADRSINGPAAAGSAKSLSRPPRSPRRPTSTSNLSAASSSSARPPLDLSPTTARPSYGLPSPPQTSSETSGGSVGGSIRLPNSVLEPAPDKPGAAEPGLRGDAAAASDGAMPDRRSSISSSRSGLLDGGDDGKGTRSERLSALVERSARIMSSLSSRRTPSPTKPSVASPTSQLSNAFAATTISSPRPQSSISSPRHSLSGEETERAYSVSSQTSSPFSERSGGFFKGAVNGAKKGKRVSIDSSTSGGGGGGWPAPATSRGHKRTASLPPSRAGSSDGGRSRSGGESNSSSPRGSSRHRRATSSIDPGRSAITPPPATPTTRRFRGTPSPSSSAALSRSQSSTSVSSRGSGAHDGPSKTPLRSSATRVRPTSGARRSGSEDSSSGPAPTPTSTALQATPSYSRSTRNLSMTASPLIGVLASSRMMHREPSSSTSSSRSRSSASVRPPPLGQSPLVGSPRRPGKERQTSAEEVDAMLGVVSLAPVHDEDASDPRARERTASNGKRRTPLPSEFRAESVASTPSSTRTSSRQAMDERMTPSPSMTSLASRALPPSSRSGHSPIPRHTPSPDAARSSRRRDSGSTANPSAKSGEPSLRSRVLRSGEPAADLKPRYLGRGGSAESALARKPFNSGLGGLGIEFPSTSAAARDDDLFSDGGGAETAEGRASKTRSLLQRIEQENLESERRTRELREVHAIKRAESSMSLARSPTSNDGHPATPLHRRNFDGVGTSRGGAYTGLPARPSTSMAFTTEAPRTAPPLGAAANQVLRSRRSAWNLAAASIDGGPSANRAGSPSPSLVRRRRLSGEPSHLGDGGRRTAMDLRSHTSFGMPSSASVQSSLSSIAGRSDGPQPDHVRNMLSAFEALERHYSRLGDFSSTAEIVRSANALVAAVEQTNLSLAQASEFVREQLVAAQVEDRREVGDAEGWRAMAAVLKDAVRMNDEEVRASTGLMIATLKGTREMVAAGGSGGGGGASGGIRRSETADWTSYRHGRETSEPSPMRADQYARPSTSMGYATISSPSVRLRDSALTRDRLASIPSSRTLNLIDVDVPQEPAGRRSADAPPLTEAELSPPAPRRSTAGVLGHVFDRFAPRRASEETARDAGLGGGASERGWRQAKTSSASTVRAPSLYPPAAKVSAATMAGDAVTATLGSPDQRLPSDDDEPAPTRGFFGRTLSLASTVSSTSSAIARQPSAGSDSTLGRPGGGGGSATQSPRDSRHAFDSDELNGRRHSSPKTTTSPIASIRRLNLFSGGSKER